MLRVVNTASTSTSYPVVRTGLASGIVRISLIVLSLQALWPSCEARSVTDGRALISVEHESVSLFPPLFLLILVFTILSTLVGIRPYRDATDRYTYPLSTTQALALDSILSEFGLDKSKVNYVYKLDGTSFSAIQRQPDSTLLEGEYFLFMTEQKFNAAHTTATSSDDLTKAGAGHDGPGQGAVPAGPDSRAAQQGVPSTAPPTAGAVPAGPGSSAQQVSVAGRDQTAMPAEEEDNDRDSKRARLDTQLLEKLDAIENYIKGTAVAGIPAASMGSRAATAYSNIWRNTVANVIPLEAMWITPHVVNGVDFTNAPLGQPEVKLQEFFSEKILPQLNDGNTFNTVAITSGLSYLAKPGESKRAPDVSCYPKTLGQVDAVGLCCIGDIKSRSEYPIPISKGQMIYYLQAALLNQPQRMNISGFITDLENITFFDVQRDALGVPNFTTRMSLSLTLSNPRGPANHMLRTLVQHTLPQFTIERIEGYSLSDLTPIILTSHSLVATDPKYRDVVIKVSSVDLVAQEVRALQALQSARVEGVITLVAFSRNTMILSPLADASVHDQRKSLPQSRMADVVHTLRACHAVNILHRDCRSSNILVLAPRVGHRKLILADFGYSCVAGSEAARGDLAGAPLLYQSPHVLFGGVFRPADDLHILARSTYLLRHDGAVPGNDASADELCRFWSSRGQRWTEIFELCEKCNYDELFTSLNGL